MSFTEDAFATDIPTRAGNIPTCIFPLTSKIKMELIFTSKLIVNIDILIRDIPLLGHSSFTAIAQEVGEI